MLLTMFAGLGAASHAPTSGPAGTPAAAVSAATSAAAPDVAPAVVSPTWINLTAVATGPSPPTGYGESLATNPTDHTTVLFGGCLADQCPSNQTWEFANGSWTNLTATAGTPPARQSASADYDPNMGGVLLFGGEGVGGTLLNDTWLYRNGSWTNLSYVGGAPAPRYGAEMAFDPDPEENGSVLYSGCYPEFLGVVCYNDTWVWEGWAGWVPLAPSLTGPGVGFAAMAFDPVDDVLVLYGGCAGFLCLGLSSATWEFSDGQWSAADPTSSPGALAQVALVWDAAIDRLVLFGGLNGSFVYQAATWEFAAGAWTLVTPSASPTGRAGYAAAVDPSGTVPLLEGGSTNTADANDTWVFERTVSATLTAAANASETAQPVQFTAAVGGGTGPYRLSVAFGDGSNLTLNGTGPTFTFAHTYLVAGTYTASVAVVDSVGVAASASSATLHLANGPTVSASVTPTIGEAGFPVAFGAEVTGGVGSATYAWTFGDHFSGSGRTPAHTYSAAGDYTAVVNVTDSVGGVATASVAVEIAPAVAVSIRLAPAAAEVGVPEGLSAAVVGGVGPFVYSWTLGDGQSSAAPGPVETFNHTGAYSVSVEVTDAAGGSAHAVLQVTVGSVPTTSSGPASPPVWFWGGVGALAAAAVVGSLLLLRRGRSPA
jgi:PKD domain/Galactose oxidase, central domain